MAIKKKLKSSKDFIQGYIQGGYNPQKKVNEALRFIEENKDMWKDNEIIKELLENIERILKK